MQPMQHFAGIQIRQLLVTSFVYLAAALFSRASIVLYCVAAAALLF